MGCVEDLQKLCYWKVATEKHAKRKCGKKAKVPNRCWFYNIATVKAPESLDIMVTYLVWNLIVDEVSGTKISGFYKAKNAMIEPICERIHSMEEKGRPVLNLWQDNADENKKVVQCLKSKD